VSRAPTTAASRGDQGHIGRPWPRRLAALLAAGLAVLAASCSTATPGTKATAPGPHRHSSNPAPRSTSTSTSTSTVPTTTTSSTQPAPTFTSAASAVAVTGFPFSFTVTTTCPEPVLITAQGLPIGLSVADDVTNCTATISGSAAAHQDGAHPVTLNASAGITVPATQQLLLNVDSRPTLRTRSVVNARTGVSFTSIATASGFPTPTITTTSPLPGGVRLVDSGKGSAALEGTPGPGTGAAYPVTIIATNGVLAPASQPVQLTVVEPPAITSAAAGGSVSAGVPMAPITVTATGYPTPALSAVGLPAGVTLTDHQNGTATLGGTPAAKVPRPYTVTIRARNRDGIATQQMVLTVT